jgi:hypothetical protein
MYEMSLGRVRHVRSAPAMAKRTAGHAENKATLPNLHRIKIEIRKDICRRMFAGKESCQRKSRGRLARSRLLLCC